VSIEHSDHEVIGGAQRSVQQLVFTAAQLVEVIARMRAAADQRRETDARAAAASDRGTADRLRARQDSDRRAEQTARAGARQQWAPVNDRQWRHDATPEDLLTGWAAATTWAGSDQQAAAAMLRAEDEIRDRWPNVTDRYDRLRVDDGLHPAAAMTIAVTDAANAGWDPITNPTATPRPPAPTRPGLRGANVEVVDLQLVHDAVDQQAAAAAVNRAATRAAGIPDDPTTPALDEHAAGLTAAAAHQTARDRALGRATTAAELALRWQPPVGATSTPTATSSTASPTAAPVRRAVAPTRPLDQQGKTRVGGTQ